MSGSQLVSAGPRRHGPDKAARQEVGDNGVAYGAFARKTLHSDADRHAFAGGEFGLGFAVGAKVRAFDFKRGSVGRLRVIGHDVARLLDLPPNIGRCWETARLVQTKSGDAADSPAVRPPTSGVSAARAAAAA